MNHDGLPDLVGRSSFDTIIGINTGNFSFTKVAYSSSSPSARTVVDIDGDGDFDILFGIIGQTFVQTNNGNGTLDSAIIAFSVHNFYLDGKMTIGDFDGDHRADFAIGNDIFLGNGDGNFRSYAHLLSGDPSPVGAADFDGDGADDLAIGGAFGGAISIALMNHGPDAELSSSVTLTSDNPTPPFLTSVTYRATSTAGPMPRFSAIVFARDGVPFAMNTENPATATRGIRVPPGTATITATFAGDDVYRPSTATITETVGRVPTQITASAGADYIVYCGPTPRVFARLNAPGSGGLPGPGPVIFREGTNVLNAPHDWSAGNNYYFLPELTPGAHTITVEYPGDSIYLPSSASFSITVLSALDATMSASSGIHANAIGYAQAKAYAGTYVWTIENGTIIEGQGTANVRYIAGASGTVTLGVAISLGNCNESTTIDIPIVDRATNASLLYLVTPCRALDTRNTTILGTYASRELVLADVCGIPSDAKAIAATLTTVTPSSNGWLSFYPSDLPWPGTSVLSYRTGKTRANNSVLAMSPGARLTVKNGGLAVHFIIDVLGYFQ